MKQKLIAVLTLSMVASLLIGCQEIQSTDPYGLAGKTHSAITPAEKTSNAWLKILDRVKQGNADMIFLGDSITSGWNGKGKKVWDQYYTPRNAINIGVGGDRTQNVLWRLENGAVDGLNPKLAVLLIGTNNCRDNSVDETVDGTKAICAQLRTRLPKTKILMLAIFPRGNSRNKRRLDQNAIMNVQWETVNQVSKLASEIADNKNIYFLDINKSILNEDGILTREMMPDLLHLSEKGYKVWAEAMEPTVKKLMKE